MDCLGLGRTRADALLTVVGAGAHQVLVVALAFEVHAPRHATRLGLHALEFGEDRGAVDALAHRSIGQGDPVHGAIFSIGRMNFDF